jgi:hypothetical protein
MSTTTSYRQRIKQALQFAGMNVWSTVSQETPCLLSVNEGAEGVVSLSPVGFAHNPEDPGQLLTVPGAEVAEVIEEWAQERFDGADAPECFATEEEAADLWGRIASRLVTHQQTLKDAYAFGDRRAA